MSIEENQTPTQPTCTFKIYKPVREDALERMGVTTPQQFASGFAIMLSKHTGVEVTASIDGEGLINVTCLEKDMFAVSESLTARGLSYRY